MSINKQAVQSAFECIDHALPIKVRQGLFEFAVAKTLAYDAPLPSSKPDSIQGYYLQNIARPLEAKVAEVNEIALINFTRVSEMALQIWRMRLALVFDPLASGNSELANALFSTAAVTSFPAEARPFADGSQDSEVKYVIELLADTGLVDRGE